MLRRLPFSPSRKLLNARRFLAAQKLIALWDAPNRQRITLSGNRRPRFLQWALFSVCSLRILMTSAMP